MSKTRPAIEPDALRDDAEGMSYLSNLPRRVVLVDLPLAVFVFVLHLSGINFLLSRLAFCLLLQK